MARFRAYLTVMLLNLAALGAVVWALRDPRAGAVRVELPPTPTRSVATPSPEPTEQRLAVFVSGAVRSPGVVYVDPGARAIDAVRAAGGLAEDAAQAGVNLAAVVADGQQLHVPALSEAVPLTAGLHGGGDVAADAAGSASAAGHTGGGLVDVNAASESELEGLPGVGPALAARIVADREANGPFASTDDLTRVPGIGAKTLERFADRVEVH
jgi:competence protein ComEA